MGGGRGGGGTNERFLTSWFAEYTPGFVSLQADASRALRQVVVPGTHNHGDDLVDARNKPIAKKFPVERYCERFNDMKRGPRVTDDWLVECSLARFTGEVEVAHGGCLVRRQKPKIVKMKPYLNLDMGSHQAPRMARMALRLYRPFHTTESDPWNIAADEEAVRQLEEFIHDHACPGWLLNRYQQHSRAERKKAKSLRMRRWGRREFSGHRWVSFVSTASHGSYRRRGGRGRR